MLATKNRDLEEKQIFEAKLQPILKPSTDFTISPKLR